MPIQRVLLLLPILAGMLFTSCKADFSPNAEWREVPAVYCVLDVDDTVSFVRVQKCYLGDDLKGAARIADSVNYPSGELSVFLLKWRDESHRLSGNAPLDTLHFAYTLLSNKDTGLFASPSQPVYSRTNSVGDLDPSLLYELQVRHADDGSLVAQATTTLVGDAEVPTWLTDPNPSYGKVGFFFNSSCKFGWCNFSQGRRYQLSLRYYYRHRYYQPEQLHYVDMEMPVVQSSMVEGEKLTSTLSEGAFLVNLTNALKGDTMLKTFVDTVQMTLNVCNEPLHAYFNSIAMATTSLDQERTTYSNIQGGIGVFASRRTRLHQLVAADKSDIAPHGLHYLLENLDIGFQQPEK